MITKEQVPAWLADVTDKLMNTALKSYERENIKATLITIRDFIDQKLGDYASRTTRKV